MRRIILALPALLLALPAAAGINLPLGPADTPAYCATIAPAVNQSRPVTFWSTMDIYGGKVSRGDKYAGRTAVEATNLFAADPALLNPLVPHLGVVINATGTRVTDPLMAYKDGALTFALPPDNGSTEWAALRAAAATQRAAALAVRCEQRMPRRSAVAKAALVKAATDAQRATGAAYRAFRARFPVPPADGTDN